MNRITNRLHGLSSLLVASVVLLVVSCNWFAPPLKVYQSDDKVVVLDLQSLGEYPSRISEVEIRSVATGESVWKATAKEKSQLRKIILKAGEEPKLVGPGTRGFDVDVSTSRLTGAMTSGEAYVVRVVAFSGRSRESRFEMPRR